MRIFFQVITRDAADEPTVHEFDFYRDIMRASIGDIADMTYYSKAAEGEPVSMKQIESTFEYIHGIDLARGRDAADPEAYEKAFRARDVTDILEDPTKLRSAIGTIFLALRRIDPKTTWADARAQSFQDTAWRYEIPIVEPEDDAPKEAGDAGNSPT